MKRPFQIFAMLLVALLATGPAMAALKCAKNEMAMGASCSMGMAMGADCAMSHSLAAAHCPQDCCNRTTPQAAMMPVLPIKPKHLAVVPDVAQSTALPTAGSRSDPEIVPSPVATSPPRYILLRVFRI